ncbi:MAG: HAMP domain-containing protein [Burkholderiaceae bacterium]|nr:HAMP domain-containing protein [Burkholderiaceae bacterium]
MNAQVYPVRNTYLDAFGDMEHFYRDVMKEGSAEAAETYSESRILLSGIGAVALLGAIVMGLLITRSITRPLNEALNVAQTVAAGDLTSRIDVKTSDETGRLLQALKTMNGNLLNIVGEVRGGTHTIAEASGEVAAGSLDLSARTERQAASLEETASTMEELTSAVKQNAEHAREANALAETASRLAGEGGVMMTQLVETMGAINASSHRAVDIISVIDGIAFQTNILALNAAVEAARAGEQGRGFSVVASEVRNLAQRASQAAREIKELITASVSQAQHGNLLAEQAGTAIENIVASSTRVNVLMSEIAQAADEQTTGIEQINQAIAELDDVTQQNAALVEEASAAAQAVQDQAAGLAHAMSSFKLDHGQSELHVVSGSTQGSDYRPQFKPVSRDVARKAAGRGEARVKRLAA